MNVILKKSDKNSNNMTANICKYILSKRIFRVFLYKKKIFVKFISLTTIYVNQEIKFTIEKII